MSTDSPDPTDGVLDLLVIGGGVMGLFTAYHAARAGDRVAVLERGRVGDPATASFGKTRSYRRDYLDATYVRFADEAVRLWGEFEAAEAVSVLVRCGCLNIASSAVTPEVEETYGRVTAGLMNALGMPVSTLSGAEVTARYPYLRADVADLDPVGGLVNLPLVTATLRGALGEAVVEGVTVTAVEPDGDLVRVVTDGGEAVARSVVVTAGHGTNDVLALLPDNVLQVPLTRDRPSEAKYFTPPAPERHLFTADAMPVIAYLDTGIYLHPIVPGLVEDVKIGYYNPPDIPRDRTGVTSIADFVAQVMPGLAAAAVRDVDDVDGCDYDLVADDDFVLGAVPGFANVFVGVGWRGTGYKFAPWVGRVLFELARREGTVYDIGRFDPARFADLALETVALEGHPS
ncbi:FAD-dependent oxidoreductase [Spongisporangium articulatum]|uniref:FAD-dependent oxidoreductase n=1 Tax=Spongisporangium articulatum TaxID=3362603 RepID=A0ABW8ALA7_9ACTN